MAESLRWTVGLHIRTVDDDSGAEDFPKVGIREVMAPSAAAAETLARHIAPGYARYTAEPSKRRGG